MLTNTAGSSRRTYATTLVLPTPDGPDRTTSRGRPAVVGPDRLPLTWESVSPGSSNTSERGLCAAASSRVRLLAAELGEQRLALAVPKAAQPATRCDLQPLHRLLGSDLADAWQRLEQRGDLHLAKDVVLLGILEHLGQRGTTTLEPVLELGPGAAGGGRLLQRSGPLLLGQLRKGHDLLRQFRIEWCLVRRRYRPFGSPYNAGYPACRQPVVFGVSRVPEHREYVL